MAGPLADVLRGGFDAVFRPQSFVQAKTSTYRGSWLVTLRQLYQLTLVYAANLATYAVPLTLAGIGVSADGGSPPPAIAAYSAVLGDPTAVWRLVVGFAQNSLYILAATLLTLVTFHVVILLTLNSSGIVQSVHTVVYSTTAYLAGIFTAVWYLSTTAGVEGARTLVLNLQRAFVYAIIDVFDANLGLPGGRPDTVFVTDLSQQGMLLLAVILVLLGYYFYSLYLGARVNHDMKRTTSLLVIVSVGTSPVVYVAGSVLIAVAGDQSLLANFAGGF